VCTAVLLSALAILYSYSQVTVPTTTAIPSSKVPYVLDPATVNATTLTISQNVPLILKAGYTCTVHVTDPAVAVFANFTAASASASRPAIVALRTGSTRVHLNCGATTSTFILRVTSAK
jgi:hypothetical protein